MPFHQTLITAQPCAWRRTKANRPGVQGAFTLVEMLVVIAVIAILVSLLLPSISRAKQKARSVKCVSNLRQLNLGFVTYANDHADQLPPLNSGGTFNNPIKPHNPTNWWYRILSDAHYLPDVSVKRGIWRCPNVAAEDLDSPFGEEMEGYGVVENLDHVPGLDSLIWYAYDRQGSLRGSYRMSAIRRPAQLWLIGDVGVPKPNVEELEKYPYGGYYRTDISTFPPNALGIWENFPAAKQPGFRHSLRANVVYADGHVESKDYRALSSNENDLFGLKTK